MFIKKSFKDFSFALSIEEKNLSMSFSKRSVKLKYFLLYGLTELSSFNTAVDNKV